MKIFKIIFNVTLRLISQFNGISAHLEQIGFAIKSHGGATLKQSAFEHSFQVREKEIIIKKTITQKTLKLIPQNSSMIIGTGSTTLELAKLLSIKSGFEIRSTN